MKKTIFGFIFGIGIAISLPVYGLLSSASCAGCKDQTVTVIPQPKREVPYDSTQSVVPNDTTEIDNISVVYPSDQERIRELEARVSLLEAKIK